MPPETSAACGVDPISRAFAGESPYRERTRRGGRAGDEAGAVIALDMAVLICQMPTAAGSQFRSGELRVTSALASSPGLPK